MQVAEHCLGTDSNQGTATSFAGIRDFAGKVARLLGDRNAEVRFRAVKCINHVYTWLDPATKAPVGQYAVLHWALRGDATATRVRDAFESEPAFEEDLKAYQHSGGNGVEAASGTPLSGGKPPVAPAPSGGASQEIFQYKGYSEETGGLTRGVRPSRSRASEGSVERQLPPSAEPPRAVVPSGATGRRMSDVGIAQRSPGGSKAGGSESKLPGSNRRSGHASESEASSTHSHSHSRRQAAQARQDGSDDGEDSSPANTNLLARFDVAAVTDGADSRAAAAPSRFGIPIPGHMPPVREEGPTGRTPPNDLLAHPLGPSVNNSPAVHLRSFAMADAARNVMALDDGPPTPFAADANVSGFLGGFPMARGSSPEVMEVDAHLLQRTISPKLSNPLPSVLEESIKDFVHEPTEVTLGRLHDMLKHQFGDEDLPPLPTTTWDKVLPLLREMYTDRAQATPMRENAMAVLLCLLRQDRTFFEVNSPELVDEMLQLAASSHSQRYGKSALEKLLPLLPVTRMIRHISQRLPPPRNTSPPAGVELYEESDDNKMLSEALKLLQNLILLEEPVRLQAHLDSGLLQKLAQQASHAVQAVRFATAHCMAKMCAQLQVAPATLWGEHLSVSALQIVSFYNSKWQNTQRQVEEKDLAAPGARVA